MHEPVQVGPQDLARLKDFYAQVLTATAAESPGGRQLTRAELERAACALAEASPIARRVAWADVTDLFEQDMDPGYLAALRTRLQGIAEPVRGQNRYVTTVQMEQIAKGGLLPEVGAAAKLAARKEAIKQALVKQLGSGDATNDNSRQNLLDLVDRCRRPEEVELVRQGWPRVVASNEQGKLVASAPGVQALDKALRSFQTHQAGTTKIPAYLVQLSASAAPEPCMQADPIAGLTPLQIAKELDALIAKQGAGRLIFDSPKMRVTAYKDTVKKLQANATVQRVLSAVREAMAKQEEQYRLRQAVAGGLVLDKDSLDLAVAQPYARPLFDLAQQVGRKLGFRNEVTIVIAPHVMPNAFIYTADQDRPRVTFYTPMVEKFWNHDTQDWIKMWLDADGKPAAPHAEGAKEVPVGRLLVESVLAHELGHIRDEVVLTNAVLIYLFQAEGKNLLSRTNDPNERAAIKAAMDEAGGLLGACTRTGLRSVLDGVGRSNDQEIRPSRAETVAVLTELERSVLGEDSVEAGRTAITFESFLRFVLALRKLSRASEITADRYAVAVQGNAEWTGLMDAILGLSLQSDTTDREKLSSLQRLMTMGPEKYADQMLSRLSSIDDMGSLSFDATNTHPTTASRVKQDFLFDRDPKALAAQLREYRKLPPDQRLLAVIQLYEKAAAAQEAQLKKIKPIDGYDLLPDIVRKAKVEAEITSIETAMQPFVDMVDRLLADKGLVEADNGFVERSLKLIEDKGVDLADKTPFKRLAGHWAQQLRATLAMKGLPKHEREVGQARLGRLEKLLDACNKEPKETRGETATAATQTG